MDTKHASLQNNKEKNQAAQTNRPLINSHNVLLHEQEEKTGI